MNMEEKKKHWEEEEKKANLNVIFVLLVGSIDFISMLLSPNKHQGHLI